MNHPSSSSAFLFVTEQREKSTEFKWGFCFLAKTRTTKENEKIPSSFWTYVIWTNTEKPNTSPSECDWKISKVIELPVWNYIHFFIIWITSSSFIVWLIPTRCGLYLVLVPHTKAYLNISTSVLWTAWHTCSTVAPRRRISPPLTL